MLMLLVAQVTASLGTNAVPIVKPVVVQMPAAAVIAPADTAAILPQDTPVELMAMTEVSTASATPGTIFKMRVNKPVEIGGRVVVPVGTLAFGQVITATDAGGLGKSGRMTARLVSLQLGDVTVPLEGEMSTKGSGAGSAGVAVLLTGVMGLFHRGNNAKIKAGEIINGYVAKDTTVVSLAAGKPR